MDVKVKIEVDGKEVEEIQVSETYGAEAVRLSFNPSGSSKVATLKTLQAAFINECAELNKVDYVRVQHALIKAQEASMWAAFVATTKD